MKKLYFARHGESELNVAGRFAGHTETPLTKEGRQQAKKAGQKAKKLNIDYIVSSPLSRAHETAKIIAKEIGYPVENIHTNSLFIERFYGVLEGMPYSPDLNLDGITDLETNDTLMERAKEALDYLHSVDTKNILVVSHGSLGRAIRHHLLSDIPFDVRLKNAEIQHWL